jgi:hypothetical protein
MESVGFFAFLGVVCGFGLLFAGVAVVLDFRKKTRDRELTHAERIKALESGHPLPDAELAWAKVEGARTAVRALVGVFVPLFMVAGAAGGTALVLIEGKPPAEAMLNPFFASGHTPILCTIWGVAGLVSLLAVILSIAGSSRRRPADGARAQAASEPELLRERASQAIQPPALKV